MRRREFITLIGNAVAAFSICAVTARTSLRQNFPEDPQGNEGTKEPDGKLNAASCKHQGSDLRTH